MSEVPISLTENAAKRVAWIAERQHKPAILRLAVDGGGCADLRLVPLRRSHFRLAYAREVDMAWLQAMFEAQGRALGTRVARSGKAMLLRTV